LLEYLFIFVIYFLEGGGI